MEVTLELIQVFFPEWGPVYFAEVVTWGNIDVVLWQNDLCNYGKWPVLIGLNFGITSHWMTYSYMCLEYRLEHMCWSVGVLFESNMIMLCSESSCSMSFLASRWAFACSSLLTVQVHGSVEEIKWRLFSRFLWSHFSTFFDKKQGRSDFSWHVPPCCMRCTCTGEDEGIGRSCALQCSWRTCPSLTCTHRQSGSILDISGSKLAPSWSCPHEPPIADVDAISYGTDCCICICEGDD